MQFEEVLRQYRCYSHSLLTAMLNDENYLDSLTEDQKEVLYAAWEEFYYAI